MIGVSVHTFSCFSFSFFNGRKLVWTACVFYPENTKLSWLGAVH